MRIVPVDCPQTEDALVKFGMIAKTCYQKSSNLVEAGITQAERVKYCDLAQNLIACGHHSPGEFINYTMFVEDAPKIVLVALTLVDVPYHAMVRSLRFRKPTGQDGVDLTFCKSWNRTFDELVRKAYPGMSDRDVETLANQNSRGFVGLLTESYSFQYQIDMRNLCYLANWLSDYCDALTNAVGFEAKIRDCLMDLTSQLLDICPAAEFFRDTKGMDLDLFVDEAPTEYYGITFTHNFRCSMDAIAHLIRHRKDWWYRLVREDWQKYGIEFYAPPILDLKDGLREKYYDDMMYLYETCGIVPGATKFTLSGSGNYRSAKFMILERECGTVLLETYREVERFHLSYCEATKGKCKEAYNALSPYLGKSKCQTGLFKCIKPCFWGGTKQRDRIV